MALHMRKKTFAFCGGAFGDEGKGRIVDMVVHEMAQTGPVVVYRDNGGANAGHTIEFSNGERVAFHQLPSGVFIKGATVVLGKDMVIHPGDLLEELSQVKKVSFVKGRAKILIDEMAVLSLDTHRAYEQALKKWESGGRGSTGRGISPAYADIILRHPLRMRDLIRFDRKKIRAHYELYQAMLIGLEEKLDETEVPSLSGRPQAVGGLTLFLSRLKQQCLELKPLTCDPSGWLRKCWQDPKVAFVFEKAQAIGLDSRWGVYPDVTASDTTFAGIFSSTQGLIDPDQIEIRAGVIKATYMSSVGTRKLPSMMTEKLANRIREDAHEYGATTKRPRDIIYLDIPALSFFARIGKLNYLVLTHMDICYPDFPIKICIGYRKGKKIATYRPDQEYLNGLSPIFRSFKSWDVKKLKEAKSEKDLPLESKVFLSFISENLGLPIYMITTGPQREQGIRFKSTLL